MLRFQMDGIIEDAMMTDEERKIYEMVLTLSVYRQELGDWGGANALTFIAKEILNGTHKEPHEGWKRHHYHKDDITPETGRKIRNW